MSSFQIFSYDKLPYPEEPDIQRPWPDIEDEYEEMQP